MPKIPAAKKAGPCIGFGGLTACPHVVYLTPKQKKDVYALHRQNAATLKKLKAAAKDGPSRKRSRTKRA
jgi:hypothetical protein